MKDGIIIDGNNLAKINEIKYLNKFGSEQTKAEIQLFKTVMENLTKGIEQPIKTFSPENIKIVVSAALKYVADDEELLNKLKAKGIVKVAPAGESDDFFFLNMALENDFYICEEDEMTWISKDGLWESLTEKWVQRVLLILVVATCTVIVVYAYISWAEKKRLKETGTGPEKPH